MPTYQYNDITKWKIIPLDSIVLESEDGDFLTLNNLVQGSQFAFTAITSANDRGGQRVVGYKSETTAILLQNNLEDIQEALEVFSRKKITLAYTDLKALDDQPNGARMSIGTGDYSGVEIADFSLTWGVTQEEFYPALKINITGIFSRDLMTIPFFRQISGF